MERIIIDEIEMGRSLTAGYGSVHVAKIVNKEKKVNRDKYKQDKIVVIKNMNTDSYDAGNKIREVLIPLQHENVVQFIDVLYHQHNYMIVMEFEGQPLYELLHGSESEPKRIIENYQNEIIKKTVQGLDYLHSRNVVHGDLNSKNVLVTVVEGEMSSMKLCGFASFVVLPGYGKYTQLEYAAPEVIFTSITKESDVWAFGVLMQEIYSGKSPFEGYCRRDIAEAICTRQMPIIPRSCTHIIREMINSCWNMNPTRRPTTSAIYTALQKEYFQPQNHTTMKKTEDKRKRPKIDICQTRKSLRLKTAKLSQ